MLPPPLQASRRSSLSKSNEAIPLQPAMATTDTRCEGFCLRLDSRRTGDGRLLSGNNGSRKTRTHLLHLLSGIVAVGLAIVGCALEHFATTIHGTVLPCRDCSLRRCLASNSRYSARQKECPMRLKYPHRGKMRDALLGSPRRLG